jgi:hypothetical protein
LETLVVGILKLLKSPTTHSTLTEVAFGLYNYALDAMGSYIALAKRKKSE